MPIFAAPNHGYIRDYAAARGTRRRRAGHLVAAAAARRRGGDPGGIARGAGVCQDETVNSPSYILINEYEGKIPIYHIDLYRLERIEDIIALGLEEYLEGDGICVIEWADRMGKLLPERHIQVTITGEDEFIRAIEVVPTSLK